MLTRLLSLSKDSFRWLIAELVVVVLGILIAFQIEAWWEERSLRHEERTVLALLHEDLQTDLANLDRSLEHRSTILEGINEFARYISREENRTAKGIADRWRAVTRIKAYYPASNAYQGLKNNGRLHIISDQTLSGRLLDYYDVQQTLVLGMQNVGNGSWRKLRDHAKPDIYFASSAFRSPRVEVFTVTVEDDPSNVLNLAIRLPVEEIPSNSLLLPEIGDYSSIQSGLISAGEKLRADNLHLQTLIDEHLQALD